jgi:hypothetical protein
MRSPGVIYRQYRQQRRKLLYEKTVEALKKEHKNCIYGVILNATRQGESRKIPLCAFRVKRENAEEFELCTCPEECNAFAHKYSKEDLKEKLKVELDEILSDPKRAYVEHPDLAVYHWVLDKDLTDAKNNPKALAKPLIWLIHLLEEIVKAL